MTDQTGTLWIILMTPQKNILARISKLKKYGKLKIEELKIMYGKKNAGGWAFQILGQPTSRTFSFHDGEVALKTQKGYMPLRSHGVHVYFIFLIIGLLWLCGSTLKHFVKMQAIAEYKPPITLMPPAEHVRIDVKKTDPQVTIPLKQSNNPEVHKLFLQAKKEFQYGNLKLSLKILEKNMMLFDEADEKEASIMISEMFFLHCEKFKKESDIRKAVISCEKAIKYSPHSKAGQFLSIQEEKAKKIYLEAYTMQKFDPAGARKKYALVLQTAKSKSTWRGKAQYQLRKLKS